MRKKRGETLHVTGTIPKSLVKINNKKKDNQDERV